MRMQDGSVSRNPKLNRARKTIAAIGFGLAGLWLIAVALNIAIATATLGAADLWSVLEPPFS